MSTAREWIERMMETQGLDGPLGMHLRELLAELDRKCRWKYDDLHCKYDTSCKTAFTFSDEVDICEPSEAGFTFCPHCGKEIVSE